MSKSRIPWLVKPGYKPEVWNPLTGCSKISTGCKHCWAERMNARFNPGEDYGPDGFSIKAHPNRFGAPASWRKPRMCLVCSMGDLFHSKIRWERHKQIINMLKGADEKHIILLLTKRPLRAKFVLDRLWPDNPCWVGVSIENLDTMHRLKDLKEIPAAKRYVSFEPLLGPVGKMNLEGIDWVIAGCESGHGHRPMDEDWVREIRDQCIEQDVAFYYKQRYDGQTRNHLPKLDGKTWREYP